MANALWAGGLAMILLELWTVRRSPKLHELGEVRSRHSILVGLAQIISALIPGTSRSMVTIAAGQLSGMSRPLALEYSFWVSIPIMIAACSYDLLKALATPASTPSSFGMGQREWLLLFVGFVVSFLVAWIVILGFLRWVRKNGMLPFAIYRLIAGIWLLSQL
jgi:undecaprenyl-diphosphatase